VTTATARTSARDRLLDAARELFYAEGIHTVGIDRLIERAGVAKASLYSTFGSKDELVRAYLEDRQEVIRARIETGFASGRYPTARDKLIGVFEIQAATFSRPGYRGCAFVGANAEVSEGPAARQVTAAFRSWFRGLVRDLAAEAGAADPDLLAAQLRMLYDGASVSAWMDHDPGAVAALLLAVTALVDAGVPRA
jgi:AcrR family transcriptional regulator